MVEFNGIHEIKLTANNMNELTRKAKKELTAFDNTERHTLWVKPQGLKRYLYTSLAKNVEYVVGDPNV